MPDFGPHTTFIFASYMVVLLVLGSHVAWILVDAYRHKRTLLDMEARGIKRRSAKTPRGSSAKRKKKA